MKIFYGFGFFYFIIRELPVIMKHPDLKYGLLLIIGIAILGMSISYNIKYFKKERYLENEHSKRERELENELYDRNKRLGRVK